MNWLINKDRYLIVLGILSFSQILIPLSNFFLFGFFKTESIIPEGIQFPLFVIQIIATLLGLITSILHLKNGKGGNSDNAYACLLLCSLPALFYLYCLILLIISNIN